MLILLSTTASEKYFNAPAMIKLIAISLKGNNSNFKLTYEKKLLTFANLAAKIKIEECMPDSLYFEIFWPE